MPTLQFRGRAFVERHHENLPHHSLVPDASLSVLPDGEAPSLNGNLIVEGDNLLALQALLPVYRGRVKCIYIDPPYNTGNEHWVYNDNVSGALFKEWLGREVGPQGEDFSRHDKWCCMMYPRLQLLRELLREDGVIFISIDDNEIHHLRMLMDEIFPDGFKSAIVTRRGVKSVQEQFEDIDRLAVGHEYLLMYAKNPSLRLPHLRLELENEREGSWNNHWRGTDRKTMRYELFGIVPETGQWRWSKKRSFEAVSNYKLLIQEVGATLQTVTPEQIEEWYLSKYQETGEDIDLLRLSDTGKPEHYIPPSTTKLGSDLWTDISPNSSSELRAIMSKKVFDNPKPVRLIQQIVAWMTAGDDIVLDSFAGSGTMAHALLQMNKEDGGNRKFVLVQIPHDNKDDERAGKNIARDITRERVKRVIEGVGEKVPALGGSFTYCTLSEDALKGYYGLVRPETPWQELAGYVWQAETLQAFDPAHANPETGLVGRTGELAVYLLYTPDVDESRAFSRDTFALLADEPAKTILVYCEKLWLDADTLRDWAKDHKKDVRARLLPTQLR
jgi:DNA modification methylase